MTASARLSRAFLDNLLDTAREPLVVLDQHLKVLSVSRAFYELFQLKPRETIGQPILSLGDATWNLPRLRNLLLNLLPTQGAVSDFEVGPVNRSGGRRSLMVNARQFRGVEGAPPVILLALETTLEAARTALASFRRTQDDQLSFNQNILDTIREPLVVLDNDLRIAAVSQAFYDVFRVPSDETLGRSLFSVGNGQWNIPRLRELLDAIVLQGATFQDYEVSHEFEDIGRRTMLLNARQVRQSPGRSHIILLAIEDVTDRRQLEAEVQKSQRIESLGVLAGGIAHDFNNLMAGLMTNVELAGGHLRGGDPAAALVRLDRTPAIFARGRALTRRLLTFSKGGAPIRVITALGPLVREGVEFALVGSDLAAEVTVAPDLWDCSCDVGQIGQVVANLLINARQASPEGGKIMVGVSNVVKAGPFLRLQISNGGPSIPPEVIGRIFDPFFTTKAQGSGLGLAIAFSIVRQHGGWIDVESGPKEGTSLTVYLPASAERLRSVELPPVVESPRGIGAVLLMDDDPDILEAVGDMVAELGYEVYRSADGEGIVEAYDRLVARGVTVVFALLDSQVPGRMGGPAAAGVLRQRGMAGPVIIASGHFDTGAAPEAGDGGLWRLAKPFSLGELTRVLAGALPGPSP